MAALRAGPSAEGIRGWVSPAGTRVFAGTPRAPVVFGAVTPEVFAPAPSRDAGVGALPVTASPAEPRVDADESRAP